MLNFDIISKEEFTINRETYSGYNFYTIKSVNNVAYEIFQLIPEYDYAKQKRENPHYIGIETNRPILVINYAKKGSACIDLTKAIPATKADFNRILEIMNLSEDAEKAALFINNYIANRVNELSEIRKEYSAKINEYEKKKYTEFTNDIKKHIANNDYLINSGYDVSRIEDAEEKEKAEIKLKKGYAYTLANHCGKAEIQRFDGFNFTIDGIEFSAFKRGTKAAYTIIMNENGLMLANAEKKNTIIPETLAKVDLLKKMNNASKLEDARQNFVFVWNNAEIIIMNKEGQRTGSVKMDPINDAEKEVKTEEVKTEEVKTETTIPGEEKKEKKEKSKRTNNQDKRQVKSKANNHGGKRPAKGHIMENSISIIDSTYQYNPIDGELKPVYEYKTARKTYRFSVNPGSDITEKAAHIIMGDADNKNIFILPDTIKNLLSDADSNTEKHIALWKKGMLSYREMLREILRHHYGYYEPEEKENLASVTEEKENIISVPEEKIPYENEDIVSAAFARYDDFTDRLKYWHSKGIITYEDLVRELVDWHLRNIEYEKMLHDMETASADNAAEIQVSTEDGKEKTDMPCQHIRQHHDPNEKTRTRQHCKKDLMHSTKEKTRIAFYSKKSPVYNDTS